jgi:hypothetical protein
MPMPTADELHVELLVELEETEGGTFASSRHIFSSFHWEIASSSKYSCSGVYAMVFIDGLESQLNPTSIKLTLASCMPGARYILVRGVYEKANQDSAPVRNYDKKDRAMCYQE